MQDIQLINAGQLFANSNTTSGGSGVALDRRLRQSHLQNPALKCPRCDSLNTKFCYYNNYNLSQPRHFCKSCRRYWTKGGVLRNVPVGGGCRKSSKRSSSAAKSSKCLDEVRSKPKSNNTKSSSKSSSLTGTGNAAVIAAVSGSSAAILPSTETVSNSFGDVLGFGDPKHIFPPIRKANFGSELITAVECGGVDGGGDGGGGFTDIGSFSSLNNETATRYFSPSPYDTVSPYEQYDRPYEQWQLGTEEGAAGCGYVDLTVQIDQHHHHQSCSLGSEPLSWHQEQNQQQEMFGLTSAADQGYWSQQQWSNTDNAHLYLP